MQQSANAYPCSSAAPTVVNSKIDVIYDPIDATMKACVAGTWLAMSGSGGGPANLDTLTDVVITTPTNNQSLIYDGSTWINTTLSVTEVDPKVGALTGNQWCAANAGGTEIVCNQAPPTGGASSSGAAGYVQLSNGSGAFASSGTNAGQPLFWDSTNHKLGIGTTAPAYLLDIAGSADPTLRVRATGTNAGAYLRFVSRVNGADRAASIYADWNGDFVVLPASGKMAVNTINGGGATTTIGGSLAVGAGYNTAWPQANSLFVQGNIGAGITSPVSPLHVPDGRYAQFEDFNAGPPPAVDCDNDNERGRQSIDTANFRIYICMGAARGWNHATLAD